MDKIFMAGPSITEHEVNTVLDALRNGWYENAYYYVEKFQAEFAQYHNRKYALMTPNCTTSIHLLLTGLGIQPGDEVIVPECTWIATAAPITYLGATPVFCDIDPQHWCVTAETIKRCITPRTKAIIAVDLFGNMPQMDQITALANRHGIHLVEDAAEALGSTYRGIKAGKFGIGSVFSFHRTKTITTGEGGMLLLDDDTLYERCKFLRDHGRRTKPYYNYEVTYKYMPFNLQAALGYAQFQRLDELIKIKRNMFEAYKNLLSDIEDLHFNPDPKDGFNSVWVTAIVFGKSHKMTKADAIQKLEGIGVPARPFFYPLSSLPAYPGFEDKYQNKNPVAYDISSRGINLSCAMNIKIDQIEFICKGIRKILGR